VREGKKVKLDLARSDLDMDAAHIFLACDPGDIDHGVNYVIAADPSGGVGKDFHAAQVMCLDEGEGARIVAYIHRNDIDPTEFADWLDAAGRYFTGVGGKPATIVVERNENNEGEVLSRLRQRRYPNLFRYIAKDRPTERLAPVFGWPINKATKPEAINALARLLPGVPDVDGNMMASPRLVGIYPELRDELVGYVVIEKENGRVEMRADGNGHDDLVTSTAIGAAVLERQRPRHRLVSGEAPSGEAVRPDGPFALFDPGAVLRGELRKAERVEREAKVAYRRLEHRRRNQLRRQRPQ
jgi:hypothetical protein